MTDISPHSRLLVTRAKTARAKAERAADRYQRAQQKAALTLIKMGISMRDADLLGISHARVHQLVDGRDR